MTKWFWKQNHKTLLNVNSEDNRLQQKNEFYLNTSTNQLVSFWSMYGLDLCIIWNIHSVGTERTQKLHMEWPEAQSWTFFIFLYSFSFLRLLQLQRSASRFTWKQLEFWNMPLCRLRQCFFHYKAQRGLKLCQKGNMNPLQVMPQRWRMLRCSRKQNDEQRCQQTLRRDNGRSFCHLAPWQSMMSGPSNKPCLLRVNDEHGCNWFIISNQGAPFSTVSKRRLSVRPHRIGKHSPGVQPHVRALNELSCWLYQKPPIPLLGYFTFPLLFVFPVHLQFPPFSFAPLSHSKKGTCLLLITALLTSLFVLLCYALLKLAAFYASVLHVASFFSSSHTRISNKKLRIVSHGLTARAYGGILW